jgi:hypothetical protein
MPDPKTGEAFPPCCDIEAKLDQLEAELEYLIDMCPKDKRANYEDGKESTLVRIILRHRPKEYDAAVKTVMDLHRFRLFGKEGDVERITNLEDNSRVNYNSDWLPRYDELRAEMIASYQLQKRRREEDNKATKKSPGHPVLPILRGFEQPGPKPKVCYDCGSEKRDTSREIKRAKLDRMKSGLEPPNRFARRLRMEAKERLTRARVKGEQRELHLMVFAKETKRVLLMIAKPLASISTLAMGIANGGTTAVIVMTRKTMEKEKGNLYFFSPRRIKRSKRKS